MVGHGGSSAGSYLADPTSPIPSHCASIVATSTLRVNQQGLIVYTKDAAALHSIVPLFQTFCRFKFYLEDKPTESSEVGGINPDYNFNKQFSFTPATKQVRDIHPAACKIPYGCMYGSMWPSG